MAPKRGPAPIAAEPGRPLPRPCCPLLCRGVVGLLKEDDVSLVALQKVQEAAPLVSVPEAVDVEAEKAQGGGSGAAHRVVATAAGATARAAAGGAQDFQEQSRCATAAPQDAPY